MAADRDTIVGLIREFVAQHDGKSTDELPEFSGDRDLFAEGDLDSFGFVELLSFLADRTGQELDLGELDPADLTQVGNLVAHFGSDTAE